MTCFAIILQGSSSQITYDKVKAVNNKKSIMEEELTEPDITYQPIKRDKVSKMNMKMV